MAAVILDGKALAERLREQLAQRVAQLRADGCAPHLVAVMAGESPAARLYANSQARACEAAGIGYELRTLPAHVSEDDLRATIGQLNRDRGVTGIILQLPLPVHVHLRDMQMAIDPEKDVEGIHPLNFGRLFGRTGHVAPCTALAAVEMVRSAGVDLAGQEVVVVGHSQIVGKPIGMLLLQSKDTAPTVTVCHVATRDLAAHTRRADVLFVATGALQARWQAYAAHTTRREHPPLPDLSPLITADMVKPGAMVIDVAINRIPAGFDATGQPLRDEKGKIRLITTGDVDFEAVKEVAGHLTPVPGGVGPVTVSMLLRNTVACAERIKGQR